jgi:hypothetical protein
MRHGSPRTSAHGYSRSRRLVNTCDLLTGSDPQGMYWTAGGDATCGNWTKSGDEALGRTIARGGLAMGYSRQMQRE